MISIQNIIPVPNLIQLHRRKRSALPQLPFDIHEPLARNMFFGPEPGIKIRIFAHTADDVFQRNSLKAMVNKLHILFLGLLFVKRTDMVVVFL